MVSRMSSMRRWISAERISALVSARAISRTAGCPMRAIFRIDMASLVESVAVSRGDLDDQDRGVAEHLEAHHLAGTLLPEGLVEVAKGADGLAVDREQEIAPGD